MMADQAAVPDTMQLYKNGEVACQNCLDTALLGDRMHSHKEDKACIKCVNLASEASDIGTASSATFFRALPSRLELPDDSIERVSDNPESQTERIISAEIPITEPARRARDSRLIREPIHTTTPMESGPYNLVKTAPFGSHLADQLGQGVASRGEPNSLERIYEGSDDYALPLLKPLPEFGGFSKLMSPSTSERDVVDIPQAIQPGDNPKPPSSGRRDDSHNPEDSGYGSIAANLCLSVCRTRDGTGQMDAVADDDARTTYSNVTNEDHVQTRDFVHELSNDLHGRLKLLMGPDDWPLVSKSLPELLKAFAIRIGSNNASQASRDVMYFIHKQHWNIANQFKNLLLGLIEDGDASCSNTDMDIMSLQDKMDMWDEKISMHESAPENGELFQNVIDDYSNITASLLYNKLVLESKDYSWLVQRLETELSLERGETDPPGDDISIRQQILSMLPPSNISKKRRPTYRDVVFQFPSRPVRFLPSDSILVTPSSRNFQLTSILTYVNQTWPLFGEELLSFVGRAFGHPHFTATIDSTTLGNDARLTALFKSSFSLIRVTGPAYSVSEVGEQLAWLAAATSNPPHSTDNHVIFNKPLVTYLGNHVEDSYPPQWKSQRGLERFLNTASGLGHQGFSGEDSVCSKHSTRAMEGFIAIQIGVAHGNESHPKKQLEVLWDRFLGCRPPIVTGYPIARRLQGCPGLELPYTLLQHARGRDLSYQCRLKEPYLDLILAGSANGVFYWHEKHPDRYSTGRFFHTHGDDLEMAFPTSVLENGRHVICDRELCMETRVENTSPASSSTLSYSLTGGMLSMSSASVNIGRPDSGGSGLSFFKDGFRHIVLGYLSQAPVDGGSSASDSRSPPSGTRSSDSHSGSSRQIRPRKRDRGNVESEDDGQDLRPRKKPKQAPSRSLVKPRFLACPFWKLDPNKHWECFLKKITTVSYVNQHLSRRHTPTLYCQRCLTIFDHAESHHQHVFGEPCTPRPLARLDGISPDQSLELSKKSKGTIEEQWYAIWGILFPEERRPLSIYVDSDQSPDFVLLREFSQRQGVSILHERIRTTGRMLRSDVSEQEVMDTLGQALDSLFEYYRLGQDSVQPVPSQTESQLLSTSTLQGGTVDHGSTGDRVMVAPYYSHGSNGDDLATTATPDQNNAVPPTTDPLMENQPDPTEPLQVLEVLDTDMPEGGWGLLGEMEGFIGGESWDELCNRIIAKGGCLVLILGWVVRCRQKGDE